MEPSWKTLKGVSHFAHSSGDGSISQAHPCFATSRMSKVMPTASAYRMRLGVLVPIFLASFGLGESLPLPLIGELEPNAENLSFFLESLEDGWIGELLVEIPVPCVFHLRLFSFAVL